MTLSLPEATEPIGSLAEVFVRYLDYFRARVIDKVEALPESDLRQSRLPSGWTPVQLLNHLTHVEMRWLEWGFEGREVGDPWGDNRDERWYVEAEASLDDLVAALRARGQRTLEIIQAHNLSEIGQPGPRWEGADPATLERVLFHLLQEYARHLGQLDVVAELAGVALGE
ncbi:DinB family protein [Jatrophihabitans sp. DSM 45814]